MTRDISVVIMVYIAVCISVWLICMPYKKTLLGESFEIHSFLFKGKRIYQTKLPIVGDTCLNKIKVFTKQAETLPGELTPGHYTMVTHNGILRRIQRCKSIEVTRIKETKKMSLKRNISSICQCDACEKSTACKIRSDKKVQFYKISIIKR